MIELVRAYDELNKKSYDQSQIIEKFTAPLALSIQHGLIFCHQNFLYASNSAKMIKTIYGVADNIDLSPQVLHEIDGNIAMLNRNTLCSVVSAIEASLKTAAKATKIFSESIPEKKRLHLRWLMEHAKKINYISQDCLEKWIFIIELRNAIVHDNGIAEKNMKFIKNGRLVLEMKENKQVYGKLMAIPEILEWAITSFSSIPPIQNELTK